MRESEEQRRREDEQQQQAKEDEFRQALQKREEEAKRLRDEAQQQAKRATEAMAAREAAETLAKKKEAERLEELKRISEERAQEEQELAKLVRLFASADHAYFILFSLETDSQDWKRPEFNLVSILEPLATPGTLAAVSKVAVRLGRPSCILPRCHSVVVRWS